MTEPREHRQFFFVHADGRVEEDVTGYADQADYWWCPSVGMSGAEGYSLFRDSAAAYDAAFPRACRALDVAKANLARIEEERSR